MPGAATSEVEVSIVTKGGLWLLVREKEYYLDFDQFPWFRKAKIEDLLGVTLLPPDHLRWPGLDVDLSIEMIEHPERYPLVSKEA